MGARPFCLDGGAAAERKTTGAARRPSSGDEPWPADLASQPRGDGHGVTKYPIPRLFHEQHRLRESAVKSARGRRHLGGISGPRPDPLQKDAFMTPRMTFDGLRRASRRRFFGTVQGHQRQRRRPVKVFSARRGALFGGALLSGAFCWLTKKCIRLQRSGNPNSFPSWPRPTICSLRVFMLLCSKSIADAARKD
jgi:hypothetical protein